MYVCIYVCVRVLRVMVHRFAFFLYPFFDLFCSFFFFWRGFFFPFLLICFIIRWLSRTSHRYTNERRNVLENGSRTHECAIDMSDVSERKDT